MVFTINELFFNLNNLSLFEANLNPNNTFGFAQPIISHVAQIGISIEPLTSILQLTPDPSANPSQQSNFEEFALKAAENLFNYCASFSYSSQQLMNTQFSNQQFVPLTTIQQWFENFTRRLRQMPQFWRN
jgi:hypothetical protein